ncbi:putative coiled-coil domain-containing protein 195 [Parus major]|uniref:putative coiled-coil domain-containing protein 195 n=1 Tax=Parus major TaxID=9157 RepID=UPI0007711B3C|nr:putative coiled-coil domain-containing protein 195 [Parus major]XP_033372473.1 putative coiled-coil domain-containing protein 195 [Parus major]
MEGNTHLLQVIRKMRSQINRLERENRALKGELRGCGQRAVPAAGGGNGGAIAFDGDGAAAAAASPQGPAPLEQTDTAMTVRRYPTVSPAPAPSSTRSHGAGRKPPSNGLPEVPGSAQPPAPPAPAQLSREEEKGLEKSPACCLSYSHSSNMKMFQEHVYKCQGKVKAVSFLLPMDMSSFAEKQGSLKSPQNQSTKHLMTITEKDM